MEDKRITKTKRALKSALLELLTTQAFDVISITELCKIANVSRITFYTHYMINLPSLTTFSMIC